MLPVIAVDAAQLTGSLLSWVGSISSSDGPGAVGGRGPRVAVGVGDGVDERRPSRP